MPINRMLLSDPQCDILAELLEDGIEAAHLATVESPAGSEDYEAGIEEMKALLAILGQFDADNPIFDAEAVPGIAFNWEEFWAGVEASESGDEDDDEPISGADSGRILRIG